MESLKACVKKYFPRQNYEYKFLLAFSLIEVIIASAIIVAILAGGLPLTWEFYQRTELVYETESIIAYLKTARTLAMTNKNQMPHGLYIGPTNATIFEGVSYATRNVNKDQIFPRSRTVNASGTMEIVFSELSGTTTSGSIALSNAQGSNTISLNTEGLIQ